MIICVAAGDALSRSRVVRGEAADAGDAGNGFAAKAHRRDGGEVLRALNLAGGVTFEAEQGVIAAHAEAVIGHAHEAPAAGLHFDGEAARAGVEGVLNEFLDHAGRALDHFAGGDLVGDVLGEQANAVHVETRENFRRREAEKQCESPPVGGLGALERQGELEDRAAAPAR